MNWYWIFYLLSIVENFTDAILAMWIIALLITIAFFIVWLVNKHEIVEGYGSRKEGHELWEQISRKFYKVFLVVFLSCLFLFIFIPSRNGIMLIIAGGAIGEFVTSDEDVKEIPSELATWFRSQIKTEIQELKNLPIKKSIKEMTKKQLQDELLEVRVEETQIE